VIRRDQQRSNAIDAVVHLMAFIGQPDLQSIAINPSTPQAVQISEGGWVGQVGGGNSV
jgi:hypothetical protein